MTWLLPELELGVLLELMPLELELPELEVPELEVPELEVPELEVPELEVPDLADDEPELVEVEPVDDEPDDVVVLWVEPGSAKARAPAVTTLATVTAVVADRTFSRPFSLAAMARRMPSRCALMSTILWSRLRKSLHEPSR
ncbi:MAG: hypothetical protein ABSA53_34245 [Streptosporangiaceae bacterium]